MFLSILLTVFVILVLAFFTVRFYLLRQIFSQKDLERIRKKIAEEITLGNWEAASKELKVLQDRRIFDLELALLEIQILLAAKQFQEALDLIDKYLQVYQHNFALYRQQGKIFLSLGKALDAIESFKKCQTILKEEEDWIDWTSALFQGGMVQEAWSELEEILKQTKNPRFFALAGDCQFSFGDYQQALVLYQKALENGWNNYHILSRTAHSLKNVGKICQAEACFRKILEKDPADVSATLGLGACLEAKGKYGKALLVYQRGKAWDKGEWSILRQAGICAIYTQKYDFAEVYLRESLKRASPSPQALAFLGYSLEKQERWKEAETTYLQLVQEFPEHIAGYRALAWLFGVGKSPSLSVKEGLMLAQKAVQIHADAASFEILSACEARAGNFGRAHRIQEKLSNQSNDQRSRLRRCRAMRILRKNMPLDETCIVRARVA